MKMFSIKTDLKKETFSLFYVFVIKRRFFLRLSFIYVAFNFHSSKSFPFGYKDFQEKLTCCAVVAK
jgi:hypothetical protein